MNQEKPARDGGLGCQVTRERKTGKSKGSKNRSSTLKITGNDHPDQFHQREGRGVNNQPGIKVTGVLTGNENKDAGGWGGLKGDPDGD